MLVCGYGDGGAIEWTVLRNYLSSKMRLRYVMLVVCARPGLIRVCACPGLVCARLSAPVLVDSAAAEMESGTGGAVRHWPGLGRFWPEFGHAGQPRDWLRGLVVGKPLARERLPRAP
jgi:hypothetical protein